jgi:hypothetical protein
MKALNANAGIATESKTLDKTLPLFASTIFFLRMM